MKATKGSRGITLLFL